MVPSEKRAQRLLSSASVASWTTRLFAAATERGNVESDVGSTPAEFEQRTAPEAVAPHAPMLLSTTST